MTWLGNLLRPYLTPVGNHATAGGDDHLSDREWDGGRLTWARWAPAHPGRVGRAIRPWAVVVHATAMHADTFDALVRGWQARPGAGNAAHFIVGRTAAQGTVQVVDVGRNGNHAGGKAHGWFTLGEGKVTVTHGDKTERLPNLIHPNVASIGIEVHNAGEVRRINGEWRCGDYAPGGWKPSGAPLHPDDVEATNATRGWHRPTEWQLAELGRLLEALKLCPAMSLMSSFIGQRWGVQPNGTPPPWAPSLTAYVDGDDAPTEDARILPIVGHCTLDPRDRSDPGLPISRWLAERYS